jgi:hypothetical protein
VPGDRSVPNRSRGVMKAFACLGVVFGGLLLTNVARAAAESVEVPQGIAHQDSLSSSSPRETGSRVLSYLVSASDSPDLWGPDPPLDPTPYDWRIYDPESRRDFSFLRLAGAPSHIRWDNSFRSVEFKVGRDVFRAPWGRGAKRVVLFQLPVDSTICEFWWNEQDSSWNYTSDRHIGDLVRHGDTFFISSAEVWKKMDRGAHWTLVKRDSCWEVSCGCVSKWLPAQRADSPITLRALQESMEIGHHPYRVLKPAAGGWDSGEESLVTVAVQGIPGGRLEFMEGFGDSDHAKLPMVYVNPILGIRRTISAEETMLDLDIGQIGFQQEGPYLLVAGEYIGANARVVDLRTGKIRFRAPSQARWSVWAPWPH